MDQLRFAIMGTGTIARGLTPALQRVDGCRVTHVASRDPARSAAFSEDLGLDAQPVTYEGLLDADVDAVYLTLPNHLHVGWSILLLEAGKHVLCEKPLTCWRDEAERAFEAAERAGRLLVEAFIWPHHAQTRRLIELAQAGEKSPIGPLRMIRADRGYDLRRAHTVNTRFSHEMQGGALMDLGCYPLGLIRTLAGEEPAEVHATARLAAPLEGEQLGVDGDMAFQLTMPSGVQAQGACSIESSELGADVVLMGEWGTATTGWPYKPHPERAIIHLRLNENAPDGKGDRTIEVGGGGDVVENQFADFARAIRGETAPLPDAAWSIAQAGAIEGLLASCGVSLPRSTAPRRS